MLLIIITTAEPDLEGSTVEIAVTTRDVADSLGATKSSPPELIEVLDEKKPDTLQLTVAAGLLLPKTEAEN